MPQRKSKLAPIRRPNDPVAMTETIEWLEAQGVEFIRPTEHQIKILDVNFYPCTGTIQIDGDRKMKRKGLAALQEMLLKPAQIISLYPPQV